MTVKELQSTIASLELELTSRILGDIRVGVHVKTSADWATFRPQIDAQAAQLTPST